MGEEEKPQEKAEKEQKPKGSATGKKHVQSKRWLLYDFETKKSKRKTCPKCGAGVFLAQHKDRLSCGNCSYTEFSKKEPKPDAEAPDKPVEPEETQQQK